MSSGPTNISDLPVGVFETDAQGFCVAVNRRWCALSGLSAEASLGSGWVAAVYAPDRESLFARWQAKAGKVAESALEFRIDDGRRVFWALAQVSAIRNEAGETTGFAGTVTDIHAQKEAEQAYRDLLDRLPDPVIVHRDGVILYVSTPFVNRLGYTKEEVVGRRVMDFAYDDAERQILIERVRRATDRQVNVVRRTQLRRRDGEKLLVDIQSAPSEYAGFPATLAILREARDNERTEARLRAGIRRFGDGFIVLQLVRDADNEITGFIFDEASPGLETLFQVAAAPVLGQRLDEWAPGNEALVELYANVERNGEPTVVEHEWGSGAQERHIEQQIYPVEGGVAVVLRDLTAVRHQESEMRIAQRRMVIALEAAGDGIWDWDIPTNDLYFSPQWMALLGYGENELPSNFATWQSLVHPSDIDDIREAARRHLIGETTVFSCDHRLLTKDGIWRWVHSRGQICGRTPDGIPLRMIGTLSDLTERRHAAAQNELYGAILQSMAEGVCVIQAAEQTILFANPRFEKMFGYEPGELNGQPMAILHPPNLAADEPGSAAEIVHLLSRGESSYEATNIRKDGSIMFCRANAATLVDPEHGTVWVAVKEDITAKRRADADLLELTDRLTRSNRELQDFATVASHDLQEPLRKIQAFGDRLDKEYSQTLGAEGRDYVARMQNAAKRMSTLIDDLLALSRLERQAPPPIDVDLNRVAADVLVDLETRIEKTGGTVTIGTLPSVTGDPTQMRQLLQNLVGNALKFHRPGEPPKVRVWGRLLHATITEAGPSPKVFVEIVVEDNGIGFDPKFAERIFAVFQRLHGRSVYEGTGIGLTICRKIAERHGGTIVARSSPGHGATFVVKLPVAAKPGEPRG